jgi:DNA-binding XRE family transcriptional regulator
MVENRLQSVLADLGLSRSELARSASVPYTTVRRVTNEGGDLPLAYAMAIGRVLQIPVAELFRLSAPPPATELARAVAGAVRLPGDRS